MEEAIDSADGAADLQERLQHLHALLKQPFIQLNHFSIFIALVEATFLSFVVSHILNAIENPGSPVKFDTGLWRVTHTAMVFLILFWCAVVGDEFQRVRSHLNQPRVLMGLQRQLKGTDASAQLVFDYIQRLDLGFTLVNVTLTTHRVLSFMASVLISAVFAFGPVFGSTLISRVGPGPTPTVG